MPKIAALADLWLEVPVMFRHVITSDFYDKRDFPKYPNVRPIHAALDFAPVPYSLPYRPVVAAYTGVLDRTMDHPELGLVAVLRHYWQKEFFFTWYCHLASINISDKKAMRVNDVIGQAGWTGNVVPKSQQGTHLHFVWQFPKYGEKDCVIAHALDPMPYLVAG